MALAGDPRGYYRVLGVERTAAADEVRDAFRRRAKALHPDGGSSGDQEAFRLLLEAYEQLRDPQLRLRYDSENLAAEPRRYGADSSPGDGEGGGTGPPRGHWRAWAARLAEGRWAASAVLLALALATAFAVLGWRRANERNRIIDDLTRRLEIAREPAAPQASVTEPPEVFAAAFHFSPGTAELDPSARARLAVLTDGLCRAIAALPAGSGWLVVVEGAAERAADGSGLLIDDWETALLRVGMTAQHLVRQGVPPERVAVRFDAGATGLRPARAEPRGVRLTLLCCLAPDER